VLLAIVVERLDNGFRSAEQVEQLTGVSGLGMIPALPATARIGAAPEDFLVKKPTSNFAEAIRSVRTAILYSHVDRPPRAILITSAVPEEGKSLLSVSLARSSAKAGQKVLLIDADMRRGTLHQALGVRSEGGLSELISGQMPLEEAVRRVAGAENLSFISRGEIPPNPSELLMTPLFNELLASMGKDYDIVIIDTPPVLAVTDAAVIGHQVGTCLMVVRFGLNQQREIALAKQRLEQNGVEVKGAIFNGVQKKSGGHYAYSYYEYLPSSDQSTSRKVAIR
jgi:tyrosine-protein kinase Etk/Wzc